MTRFGAYIIFFAVGSAILSQTNYQFRLMSWMDDMGSGAWAVRAVMLVVGAGLIFAESQQNQSRQPQPQQLQPQQQNPQQPQQF